MGEKEQCFSSQPATFLADFDWPFPAQPYILDFDCQQNHFLGLISQGSEEEEEDHCTLDQQRIGKK